MNLPVQLVSTDFDGTLFAEFENPPVPEVLQEQLAWLQKLTATDLASQLKAAIDAKKAAEPTSHAQH